MTIQNDSSDSGAAARPGRGFLRIAGLAAGGVVIAVLFAFLFGFVVKILWNGLMPDLFGLKVITFWQAFGLILLAKILFGGHGHGHSQREHRSPFERRFRNAFKRSPGTSDSGEDAEPFPCDRKQWRHFREFWRDEGKKAFQEYLAKNPGR